MRRWLMFGLVGVLLVMGLGGWAAYTFLIRPSQALVQSLQAMVQADKRITVQTPYTPGGALTSDQLGRFEQVQAQVKRELGAQFTELEKRLNQLATNQEGRLTLDYRAALDLFGDSAQTLLKAKDLQIAALNAQNFSAQEYAWVRSQVYSALGLGVPNLNPEEILRQIANRDFNPTVQLVQSEVSRLTRDLVAPLRQELLPFYPLTWFGL
jgi:hypothetical protein